MDRSKRTPKTRPPLRHHPAEEHWAVQAAQLKILLEAVWRMSCARSSGDTRTRIPAERFRGDLRSLAEIVNDMAEQVTC